MKISGLSFSLKRAVGISALKGKVAKAVGIPTTMQPLPYKHYISVPYGHFYH